MVVAKLIFWKFQISKLTSLSFPREIKKKKEKYKEIYFSFIYNLDSI